MNACCAARPGRGGAASGRGRLAPAVARRLAPPACPGRSRWTAYRESRLPPPRSGPVRSLGSPWVWPWRALRRDCPGRRAVAAGWRPGVRGVAAGVRGVARLPLDVDHRHPRDRRAVGGEGGRSGTGRDRRGIGRAGTRYRIAAAGGPGGCGAGPREWPQGRPPRSRLPPAGGRSARAQACFRRARPGPAARWQACSPRRWSRPGDRRC